MRVIVLGSGVIGVTSAYYLAEAGHEVVVLDRQEGPALETSFANAGEVSPGYASPWAAPGIPIKALKWLFMRHRPLFIWPKPDPGGNVDMRLLSSVILRGLVRDGRIARLRVAITDQPGLLAKVAQLIGEAAGNIVGVHHGRAFSRLSAKSAELEVILETRGRAHLREIVNRLTATGYTVSELDAAEGSTVV